MITYLYWFLVIAIAIGVLVLFGKKDKWKPGFIGCGLIFLVGLLAYYFHFQQVFVKRYGGVMSVTVPEGQQHITATWKDDNLWIENYDPESNTCHFNEYSKGNLLQGKVVIKNCSPVAAQPPYPKTFAPSTAEAKAKPLANP
ncbi:hypothetical protein [Pseudomaricurvus sp.]|uniref:hypothetical protein n=1 Tax=Pseudomaricurvus sp. TaxID=2004510 RepID=UPI003F6D29E3